MPKSKRTEDGTVEWVLPAAIPFSELKGRDLEECVYWLFDALGAKDLKWRTGGTGGGAADGGRDLEAHFCTPSVDDELEPKIWWIECKGRSGTVEKSEVQEAVNNSTAKDNLDYLVIATDTQFSNPTRDWVKEWQTTHKRPKVKLWDSEHLERMLSKHPSVVVRLFSDALSIAGRVQGMEARFWNRLEYSAPGLLKEIWNERKKIDLSAMAVVAAVASEFSNGDITKRSWGAAFDNASLVQILHIALINLPYLAIRSSKSGIDQTPIFRSVAYLTMCVLRGNTPESVADLVTTSVFRGDGNNMPDDVKDYLLLPIVDQILSELQDVCSDDCLRMIADKSASLRGENDEIKTYWLRFEEGAEGENGDPRDKRLLIVSNNAPCNVGFPVNETVRCPLFAIEPTTKNLCDVLKILKNVVEARIAKSKPVA
jgi:hypothetical protein